MSVRKVGFFFKFHIPIDTLLNEVMWSNTHKTISNFIFFVLLHVCIWSINRTLNFFPVEYTLLIPVWCAHFYYINNSYIISVIAKQPNNLNSESRFYTAKNVHCTSLFSLFFFTENFHSQLDKKRTWFYSRIISHQLTDKMNNFFTKNNLITQLKLAKMVEKLRNPKFCDTWTVH